MNPSKSRKRSQSRLITYALLILLGIVVLGGSTLISSNLLSSLPAISVDSALANALIPYNSETTGATIYYPEGWAIQEVPSELGFRSFHIASNNDALDAMEIPQQGGILSLSLLTADLVGATPNSTTTVASLLELQNRGMAEIPGAVLTEPTYTYRLREWEMAQQVYRIEGTGDPYLSLQFLMKRGDTYISASGFAYETEAATARPLFYAILSRITLPPVSEGQ